TYPERLANKDVDPGYEAFHRGLNSQADDNLADAERGKHAIPIDENDRDSDDRDNKRDDQMHHALKSETSGRVLDPAQRINGNNSRDSQKDHNQRCAAQNSHDDTGTRLRQRNQPGTEEKVHHDTTQQEKRLYDEPELVFTARLDPFITLFASGPLQLLANLGPS